MSREAQNPRQGWRLAWFCNEVDRAQNHAPEGVRPKTSALPIKPLACALGTRRAVLAGKSSRFVLERAWRKLCRASLGCQRIKLGAYAFEAVFCLIPDEWFVSPR